MKQTRLDTLKQMRNASAGMQRGALQNFSSLNPLQGNSLSTVSKFIFFSIIFVFVNTAVFSQNCPIIGNSTIVTNPNTYYPGTQATVNAGAVSITLGAVPAGYGVTPIASGDMLMIIQMQGTQICFLNNNRFGDSIVNTNANGYTNTNLVAGKMEFVIANNAVPLIGGTLNLLAGTTNNYKHSVYGAFGQYTYQVIRVNTFYNVKINATINTPLWNGAVGGVTIIEAVNQIDFNGKTINAIGAGFRGGGGRKLGGGTGSLSDYWTLSTDNANGSKGEGISGSPRFMNNNGVMLDNIVEGYPGGASARGAPGNAGGGATDGNPPANDENSGGGGGANGGIGGNGGATWNTGFYVGGEPGKDFAQNSPSRLVLGGGGGAGTTNDGSGTPAGFASSGSAGGGMVIVAASSIIGVGTINAKGIDGNSTVTVDGCGGGGGGGSVLMYAASGLSNILVNANGGAGGSNSPIIVGATQHGPGGGGGGGVIYSNAALNILSSVNPGAAGISTGTNASDTYGASGGAVGIINQGITLSQLPPNMTKCLVTVVLSTNLLDFTASYSSLNNVLVSWTASNELNTSSYSVERSEDGINFSDIGSVNANNSGNTSNNYDYHDYLGSVHSFIVYYRLKMVDISGNYSYSKIISLSLDKAQSDTKITIYPNPTTDYAILKLYSGKQDVAIVKLMDNAGKEIMKKSIAISVGNNSLMIDRLNSLPRGVYFIQVIAGNSLSNEKLIKE